MSLEPPPRIFLFPFFSIAAAIHNAFHDARKRVTSLSCESHKAYALHRSAHARSMLIRELCFRFSPPAPGIARYGHIHTFFPADELYDRDPLRSAKRSTREATSAIFCQMSPQRLWPLRLFFPIDEGPGRTHQEVANLIIRKKCHKRSSSRRPGRCRCQNPSDDYSLMASSLRDRRKPSHYELLPLFSRVPARDQSA